MLEENRSHWKSFKRSNWAYGNMIEMVMEVQEIEQSLEEFLDLLAREEEE
jgi:hypothetical protein